MVNLYWTTQTVTDFGFGIPEGSVCFYTSQHEDFLSWANSLFQDKKFKTRAEFNAAYDRVYHGGAPRHVISRCGRTVHITKDDLTAILKAIKREESDPSLFGPVAEKIADRLTAGKTVFLG